MHRSDARQPLALWLVFALMLAALATALPALASEPDTTSDEAGDKAGDQEVTPAKFEKHYLVLLMRPENPPTFSDEEGAKIQSAHLGHLHKLWVDGDALIAGPFEVPDDELMRGLVLFRGDLTTEEVKALAESDPAVKAGRLEVKVLPWWHGEGFIQFTAPPASGGE